MARTENQRTVPKWLFIAVAVIVAARIATSFISQHEETSENNTSSLVKWIPIGAANQVASRSHKRILYEFSAAWCGPCKIMEREVFADRRLAAMINERFVPVRVVDRQAEEGSNPPAVDTLQRTYRVRAFPTVVIADASGASIDRSEGYNGPRAFEEFIDASRTTH